MGPDPAVPPREREVITEPNATPHVDYRAGWSTVELEDLRRLARRFFETEAVPQRERWEAQHHADRSFWTKAGELGLVTAMIPERFGGNGATFLHEAVIIEEQARSLVSGWGNHVHSIAAHYLMAFGTAAQHAQWLPRMAKGELIGAIAMSEPGAGSDLQAMTTRAVRQGDEYVVNGSKTFITNGLLADVVVLAVKTDPALGAKGISLLVVETGDGLRGFRRGEPLRKIGMSAQDTTELFFDDVRVPVGNLLGPEGSGFAQLMKQLPYERLLIAMHAVGTIERALDETVRHVKGRAAFGKRLFDLQNTRFTLAECETAWRVTRSFLDECIELQNREALDAPTAAMAKWWATDQQCRIIDECLQLHGGYGYIVDYPIARMYADARVERIYGGANEIMKELVARSL